MKNLLIPIDYSKTSEHAIDYAIQNIAANGATLHIVHAFSVPIVDPLTPLNMIESVQAQQLEIGAKIFNNYKDKLVENHPMIKEKNITIRYHYNIGFAEEVILLAEEDLKPDAIIMGSNGKNKHRIVFGSIATKVATKTKTPTFLIPLDAPLKNVEQIVFAMKYQKEDESIVRNLLKTHSPNNSSINCFHVNDGWNVEEVEMATDFESTFHQEIEAGVLQYEVVVNKDIISTIENKVKDVNADLLVVLSSQKNLMEKLFRKNKSRQLIFHSDTPVLVYHQVTN